LNNLDNPNYTPAPLLKRLPGPGVVGSGSGSTSRPRANNGPLTEEQKKRNLDELAALGVAMPESYAKENAMVGEWETVRVVDEQDMVDDEDYVEEGDGDRLLETEGLDGEIKREDEGDTKSGILRTSEKRKLGSTIGASAGATGGGHPLNEEDDDETEARRFKVRTKEYPVNGDVDGLDDLLGKGKMEWKGRKKVKPNSIVREEASSSTKVQVTESNLDHTLQREVIEVPKVENEEGTGEGTTEDSKTEGTSEIKREAKDEPDEEKSTQTAEADTLGFKKRKVRNKGRGALA